MKKFALLVVLVMVLASLVGISNVLAEESDPPRVIGSYRHLLGSGDLTEDHLVPEGDGLRLDAPQLAESLSIDMAYLDERLSGWAAEREFTVSGSNAIFTGKDVLFAPFTPDSHPQFTLGSKSSVLLTERPMWVSVTEAGHGLKIEMDDGDGAGQQVYVAKEWLWEHGIPRPDATHETGEQVPVSLSEDASGYLLDMPHFSWALLTPADIDVKGRQSGLFVPHDGDIAWNSEIQRLEINVTQKLTDYEVWVEKDWVDVNITYHGLREHTWTVGEHEGRQYYVVLLHPKETPTVLVFEKFYPTETPTYTRGNPDNIQLWAINETMRKLAAPVQIQTLPGDPLNITVSGVGSYRIEFNESWLADSGAEMPTFEVDGNTPHWFNSYDGKSWVVEMNRTRDVRAIPTNGTVFLQESREQWATLSFDNATKSVTVENAAYGPWTGDTIDIVIVNVQWYGNYWGTGKLASINVTVGGQTIAEAHPAYGDLLVTIDEADVHDVADKAITLVFQETEGGSHTLEPVDNLISDVAQETRHFVQTDQECTGTPFNVYGDFNKRTHPNTHHHDTDGDGRDDTGYVSAREERIGGWVWNREYWYGYCPGDDGWTGTATFEGGAATWGSTKRFQLDSDSMGIGSFGSGSFYTPGGTTRHYVRISDPVLHMQTPIGSDGRPILNYGLTTDADEARLQCTKLWKYTLAEASLQYLLDAFGPAGSAGAFLLDIFGPSDTECTIEATNDIFASRSGKHGGGPEYDQVRTTRPFETGSHVTWANDGTSSDDLGVFSVKYQPWVKVRYYMKGCHGCSPAEGAYAATWTEETPRVTAYLRIFEPEV